MTYLELALEDIRARQTAVVDHIRAFEGQALSLLGVSSALAVACISAVATVISQDSLLPIAAAWALGGAAASFAYGTFFSIRVMSSTEMGLPAKDGSFWTEAVLNPESERSPSDILAGYIASSKNSTEQNEKLIKLLSRRLQHARAGIGLAPISALVAGGGALGAPYFIPRIFGC